MPTTTKTLTIEKDEVCEGECFISYLGAGLELGLGADPGDDEFHQIPDRTFNYGGSEKVWLRKPLNCEGLKVIAKIHTPA